MSESPPRLQRVLTFWDVLVIAIGQIVGAGVIALTGIAIGMTGPSVVLAYLASSLLVLVVTVMIMMAGSMLPATGAYYAWASRLGNGHLGSLMLSLSLLGGISLSLYGSSFGLYLNPIFPFLSVNAWGIVVIALLFAANLFGLRLASKVQMVLVLLLLSALGVYAGFAMPQVDTSLLTPAFPEGVAGFVTAVFLLKFATNGAYLVVGISGEMRAPRRDIPRVMVVATLLVAGIYALVALASVGVVPWQDMIDQPLTVAGREFLPGWALTYFLIAGAGLAICTTLNSHFIQTPRNFIAASWDNLLPAWVSRLNRHGAPYVILTIKLAIGIVPLLLSLDIGEIARAATIAASLPAFIVYWAITQIPQRYPRAYAEGLFRLSKFWLWTLFGISQFANVVGVYYLSRDLPAFVIYTLVVWITLSLGYYPWRRRYLARRGFDLDAATRDARIFTTD
ncbi:MAG: APC family permease [Pseudomonadota bacterium]